METVQYKILNPARCPAGYRDTYINPADYEYEKSLITEWYKLLHTCFPTVTFRPRLHRDMERIFIAYEAGRGVIRPVASVAAGTSRDGRPALHWVATDPAHRDKGLAEFLCSKVVQYFFGTHGYEEVVVRMTPPTPAGVRLYEKLGFVKEGE